MATADPRPKLYPLIMLAPKAEGLGWDAVDGPKTDEEKAAWDAGDAGEPNPHPDDARCDLAYRTAVANRDEWAAERAWTRANGHKF